MDRRGFLKACGAAAVAPMALATAPKRRSGTKHIIALGPDDVGLIVGPWDDVSRCFYKASGGGAVLWFSRRAALCPETKASWALLHRSVDEDDYWRAFHCVQAPEGPRYGEPIGNGWILVRTFPLRPIAGINHA